jgi:hypothetical protein
LQQLEELFDLSVRSRRSRLLSECHLASLAGRCDRKGDALEAGGTPVTCRGVAEGGR